MAPFSFSLLFHLQAVILNLLVFLVLRPLLAGLHSSASGSSNTFFMPFCRRFFCILCISSPPFFYISRFYALKSHFSGFYKNTDPFNSRLFDLSSPGRGRCLPFYHIAFMLLIVSATFPLSVFLFPGTFFIYFSAMSSRFYIPVGLVPFPRKNTNTHCCAMSENALFDLLKKLMCITYYTWNFLKFIFYRYMWPGLYRYKSGFCRSFRIRFFCYAFSAFCIFLL